MEERDLGRGGPLMIVREPGEPRPARVIGSLTGDAVRILLDTVGGGVAALDLSEVEQVDDRAVRVLATLPPERCPLVACPRCSNCGCCGCGAAREAERSGARENEEAVMTTSTAEEKDEKQRADVSVTRLRRASERGESAGCAEPTEHGLDPGAEPCTAPAVTGRRGRQADYL